MSIRIKKIFSSIPRAIGNYKFQRKEKQISKNFNMQLGYWDYSNLSNELYLMREPIANFAKKHGVKIDVFNPDKLSAEALKTGAQPDRIAVRVSNPKSSASVSEIFDCDISKVYPKEREYRFPALYPIPGEDIQKSLTAKWSVEDSPIRHIFRAMEAMISKVKNK